MRRKTLSDSLRDQKRKEILSTLQWVYSSLLTQEISPYVPLKIISTGSSMRTRIPFTSSLALGKGSPSEYTPLNWEPGSESTDSKPDCSSGPRHTQN